MTRYTLLLLKKNDTGAKQIHFGSLLIFFIFFVVIVAGSGMGYLFYDQNKKLFSQQQVILEQEGEFRCVYTSHPLRIKSLGCILSYAGCSARASPPSWRCAPEILLPNLGAALAASAQKKTGPNGKTDAARARAHLSPSVAFTPSTTPQKNLCTHETHRGDRTHAHHARTDRSELYATAALRYVALGHLPPTRAARRAVRRAPGRGVRGRPHRAVARRCGRARRRARVAHNARHLARDDSSPRRVQCVPIRSVHIQLYFLL